MAVSRKAISQKDSTGHCSGLIFEGFHLGDPGRILPLRPSQSCLKPSKIVPHPPNAIDIALRGMAVPGETLVGLRQSFARNGPGKIFSKGAISALAFLYAPKGLTGAPWLKPRKSAPAKMNLWGYSGLGWKGSWRWRAMRKCDCAFGKDLPTAISDDSEGSDVFPAMPVEDHAVSCRGHPSSWVPPAQTV
jgi:hypothetical protein